MKMKIIYPCLAMLCAIGAFSSCKKDASSTSSATKTTATTTTAALSSNTVIAVASVASSIHSTDSIYLVNCYPPHSKRDTIAFSALPSAVGTYLTTNYSGYTFVKAYVITDSLKATTGYIVVIKYNGSYIGLKFSVAGAFVNVLEQKDGADMGNGGKGWHPGGPFCDRGGPQHDTIALSAIPSAVLTYFTTTYPADTLLHAYKTPDTTYVLISKDTVLYATNITPAGTLIKRVKIEQHGGKNTPVTAANLPTAITTYLTATYPGYVFLKAYAQNDPSAIVGYHVFITANSTNYVVDFSSTGTFLKATVIH